MNDAKPQIRASNKRERHVVIISLIELTVSIHVLLMKAKANLYRNSIGVYLTIY